MSAGVAGSAVDIRGLVGSTLGVARDLVGPDLEFRSIPEWDSLSHVALMVALEEELGVVVPDDMVARLRSVAAIEAYASGLRDRDAAGAEISEGDKRAAPTPDRRIERGLAGVAVDRTVLSSIDGQAGRLCYRGYFIEELLEHSTFEETCFLLTRGRLPSRAELEEFEDEFRSGRELPERIVALIASMPGAHPMAVLRTAVSALGANGDVGPDDPVDSERAGVRLAAQVGAVVATHASLRAGRTPPKPDPTVAHAHYLLEALRGRPPTVHETTLFDRMMILHAEHGANASAFAARVVTSTRAGLHAALTAAIAAFGGTLHGGAAESVMQMLDSVREPEEVGAFVERRLAAHEPVYGFGHRVYRVDDPRFRYMRRVARELAEASGQSEAHRVLEAFVDAMRPRARHGLAPNVDLYTGFLYRALGLPSDLAAALFALGRAPGWVAHVSEQVASNVLIRPDLEYVGPSPRAYSSAPERAGERTAYVEGREAPTGIEPV